MNIRKKVILRFPEKYNKKFDITYIKPLYKLASIFGLTPYYNFEKTETITSRIYYTPQILSGLIIFLCYIHFLEGCIQVFFGRSQLTEVVVDSILYIFISILNLVSVIISSLLNRKKWIKMLNTFKVIDKQIGVLQKSKSNISFILTTSVESILVLGIFIYECVTFLRVFGFKLYKFYLFQRLQYFFIFITIQLICHFSLSLNYRFQFFNDILVLVIRKKKVGSRLKMYSYFEEIHMYNFKSTIKMFMSLRNLVNIYNEIFGWQILIFMGIVVLALLECLNFVLLSGFNTTSSVELYENEVVVLPTLISIMILLWGILVIFCCDSANREAHRTATICYQLLTELPESSPETEKLLYLAQHAAHRCPQITAANVFVVNINALFGIMGSLTSYVIVLISFNNTGASPHATTMAPYNSTVSISN